MKKQKEFVPISNEEVQQIINENPSGAAYGCGSGCGSGSGSGYGSGDDITPDDPRYYIPEDKDYDQLRISFDDQVVAYDEYRFRLSGSGFCNVHRHRDNHGEEWRVIYDDAQFTFSVSGMTVEGRNSATGEKVYYTTEGGSFKTPLQRSGGSVDTSVRCSTISPKSQNIVITVHATFTAMQIADDYLIQSTSMNGTASPSI